MKVFILSEEKANDNGVKFDSVPFKTQDEAQIEAEKRVKTFTDEIVREYAKDDFIHEKKPNSYYCVAAWSMFLYDYCTIREYDI